MIKSATEDDCDISFNIFELPDHTGHCTKYGFWKRNPFYLSAIEHCDKNAYLINEAIEKRTNYQNEDWFFIVTTDHGGHLMGMDHSVLLIDKHLLLQISQNCLNDQKY